MTVRAVVDVTDVVQAVGRCTSSVVDDVEYVTLSWPFWRK